MAGFLNTYFELLQFIEIIYITNNAINKSFVFPSYLCKAFYTNIQTAVSSHPLKIEHMFI